MSAINNAWNPLAGQQASNGYNTGWTDPRYGNYPRQQGLASGRGSPRKQDMPESLIQEMTVDPEAQRYWYQLDPDRQWGLVERYQKNEESARQQAIADAYDPNNDNAYSVSLSTAVDLWRAKHGDAWVRAEQVYAEGDFYCELENRLSGNQCFEVMTKHMRRWIRLKENV